MKNFIDISCAVFHISTFLSRVFCLDLVFDSKNKKNAHQVSQTVSFEFWTFIQLNVHIQNEHFRIKCQLFSSTQIPLHPLLDGLIQEVINLAFKHFKYKEG